jgi:hypothetical protein
MKVNFSRMLEFLPVQRDSRVFGVPGSFCESAVLWTWRSRMDRALRNAPRGAE